MAMQFPTAPMPARPSVNGRNPLRPWLLGTRASGFSLLEVLVALVLLAVGLLGTATCLIEALSSSRIALERSRAVVLASDMVERIRANRTGGAAYDTSNAAAAPVLDPACGQPDDGCHPAVMARHDLRHWLDAVEAQLPRGVGTVEVAALAEGGLRFTVRIAWARSASEQPAVYALETET
jgi:type IV pilus assembly protein PilV